MYFYTSVFYIDCARRYVFIFFAVKTNKESSISVPDQPRCDTDFQQTRREKHSISNVLLRTTVE